MRPGDRLGRRHGWVTEHHPRTRENLPLTPLSSRDLLTFLTEPVTVEAGSVLATARCLICRRAVGRQAVHAVALVACTAPPAENGQLVSRGYLIHRDCRPAGELALHAAAHRLEHSGCPDAGHV